MELFITLFLISMSVSLSVGIFIYWLMIRESMKNIGQPNKYWKLSYKQDESTFEGEEK